MRHLAEGTLRRLVDEPAGVSDPDRNHAAGCRQCRSGLEAAARDAAFADAALGHGDTTADPDVAWRRLSRTVAEGARPRAAVATSPPRRRTRLSSPVVAALCVLALVTAAGAAAAADWLQVFRAERVAPIAVTPEDVTAMADLPDLSDYGSVQVLEDVDVSEVADAAAAEAATGLTAPQVADLPRGVTGEPVYQVAGVASLVFTFSAEDAERAAAAAGGSAPAAPAALDGSRFRLSAGPGVAAVWPGGSGLPALVAARAVAPSADSTGASFEVARDYLLSLPGLPDDVASQLRRLTGDGTTLPLPVPTEEATTATATVGGVPATVLTARDGTTAGVVWVDDGTVTAVAGSLSADEVLAVARGLQ
jgi:hypothetical protein